MCDNKKNIKQCTFHTLALSISHYPATLRTACSAWKDWLCLMSLTPQRPHRRPILLFLFVTRWKRPVHSVTHTHTHNTNRINSIAWAVLAKNTQPGFSVREMPSPSESPAQNTPLHISMAWAALGARLHREPQWVITCEQMYVCLLQHHAGRSCTCAVLHNVVFFFLFFFSAAVPQTLGNVKALTCRSEHRVDGSLSKRLPCKWNTWNKYRRWSQRSLNCKHYFFF